MAGVWKRDGTIAVTKGSKKVVGTGTTFADPKNAAAKGHLLVMVTGTAVDLYEVDYSESNSVFYLVEAYRGDTGTGKAYAIDTSRTDSIPEFARRLNATLGAYQQQGDAFQALLTSDAATIEVTAPDGTKHTMIPWKRVTSEGEGQAARAKAEADKAASSAALAGSIVEASALPLPDVWAPLSDSLRMITGYGREVKVGDDVVARMVGFSRSTTATYIGKDGQLKTAAANEPRFEREGLLVEGSSTNLWWNLSSISVSGALVESVTLPTGLSGDAYKVTPSPTVYAYVRNMFTQQTGPHSLSCFAKRADGSNEMPTIYAGKGGALNTKAAGVYVGSGWWRMYAGIADPVGNTGFGFSPTATDTIPVHVCFFQLEALPFASSYIPTAGAAVTRAADICWLPMAGNSGNSMSFALTISGFKNAGPGSISKALWYEGSASGPYFGVRYRLGEILAAHGASPAGTTIYASGLSALPAAVIAISPGVESRVGQYTATQKADSSKLQVSAGNLYIGSFSMPGQELWGCVRNLRIWHRALTDEQIKAIA